MLTFLSQRPLIAIVAAAAVVAAAAALRCGSIGQSNTTRCGPYCSFYIERAIKSSSV